MQRPEARALVESVEVRKTPGGNGLLSGDLAVELHLRDGSVLTGTMADPPGSPWLPPSPETLALKIAECTRGVSTTPAEWTWESAPGILRDILAA